MRPYRDGTLTFYTDILLLYFELLYSCISGLAHSERYLTTPVLLFGIIPITALKQHQTLLPY